jgi:hypothetical protein
MGLALSEEKTELAPWRYAITFLGSQLHGKQTRKGTSIRPSLSLPHKKLQGIKEALQEVGGYRHIPAIDLIVQTSAMSRGGCHYYHYATSPQAVFGKRSDHTCWLYAHYVARRHRLSIAQVWEQEKPAGRLGRIRNGRTKLTSQVFVEGQARLLGLFPPRTGQMRAVAATGQWTVDLKPVIPMNWQSGRSLATRTAALESAQGICERCGEKPGVHVHHTVPLRGKTFLARGMSDSAQRHTAHALCKECHLEVHDGSFAPRRRKGQGG